jgi:hypothetical protein
MLSDFVITGDYVTPPINSLEPLSQVTIFLAMFCHILCSIGRRPSNFIMACLQMIVGLSFCHSGKLEINDKLVLDQIPDNIRLAAKKFKLEGKITIYAICPKCNKTYPPQYRLGSSTATYKSICNGRTASDRDECGATLTKPKVCSDGSILGVPIKTFAYHSLADYIACLLSRCDLELAAEKAMDDIVDASTGTPKSSPANMKNIFDGAFIREFKGPDGQTLFAHRRGETRLLFSLFVDFFNVNTVLSHGATTSNGIIAMACLNLTFEQRYLPENLYIAGIIPGPKEPTLMELNHFLKPLIDELADFWEPGFMFSRTALHSNQVVRCALACVICDLPAARKVGAFAGVVANHFCTVCSCNGKLSLGRIDTDHDEWQPRNPADLRQEAEKWRDGTLQDQHTVFQDNGLRYSVLWRLAYWDPSRQLVVDPMHCLFENLAHHHFRDYLALTVPASKESKAQPAFSYPFTPYKSDSQWRSGTIAEARVGSLTLTQHTKAILKDLTSSAFPDVDKLSESLRKHSWASLHEVCTELGVTVRAKSQRRRGKPQKDDLAWSLALHVSSMLSSTQLPNNQNPIQSRVTENPITIEPAQKVPDCDSEKIAKEVLAVHVLLTQPLNKSNDMTTENLESYFATLLEKLQRKSMAALEFVAEDLKVSPIRVLPVHAKAVQIMWRKVDVARGLVEWVSCSSLLSNVSNRVLQRKHMPYQPEEQIVRTNEEAVLQHIWKVIRDTEVPSWVYSVPKQFGEPKTGTLKADEWRSLSTIFLPLALVSLWGEGSSHSTEHRSATLRKQLDHTMHLVSAIHLACSRDMSEERVKQYDSHMKSYIAELVECHPHASRVCNQHMSLHLPMFLVLFGPVYSWWAFVFERLIGRLQRLPSNNKFGDYITSSFFQSLTTYCLGELEPTLLQAFIRAGRLRRWLSREDAPLVIKECSALLDHYMPKRHRGIAVDYSFPLSGDVDDLDHQTTLDEDSSFSSVSDLPSIRSAIKLGPGAVLKKRVSYAGTTYSCPSSHIGNSNVLYHLNNNPEVIPGRIRYIFIQDGRTLFLITHHLDKCVTTVDPFLPYSDFPARLFSSHYATYHDLVDGENLVGHFAHWVLEPGQSVIVSLKKFGNPWTIN